MYTKETFEKRLIKTIEDVAEENVSASSLVVWKDGAYENCVRIKREGKDIEYLAFTDGFFNRFKNGDSLKLLAADILKAIGVPVSSSEMKEVQ